MAELRPDPLRGAYSAGLKGKGWEKWREKEGRMEGKRNDPQCVKRDDASLSPAASAGEAAEKERRDENFRTKKLSAATQRSTADGRAN